MIRPINWLATTTSGLRRGLCTTAVLAFLALLAVFPVSSPGSLVEKIVVVVNGVPNTFSDLRKFARTKLKQDVDLDELTAGRVPKQWLEEFITHELIGPRSRTPASACATRTSTSTSRRSGNGMT